MCVQALTNVVIIASGFYDCMHCTSVHVVIPVRVCAASTESEVMVAHKGRWAFRVGGELWRIGHRGFYARSAIFPSTLSSYIYSLFRVQGMGIVETTIPEGRTKRGEGIGQ